VRPRIERRSTMCADGSGLIVVQIGSFVLL